MQSDVNRIWDCLLFEGPIVLHRVCLALCKIKEAELLKIPPEDFGTLYEVINRHVSFINETEIEVIIYLMNLIVLYFIFILFVF